MWFFRSKKEKIKKARTPMRRVVAGLIIGGAVASIVGKRVVDRMQKEEDLEEDVPPLEPESDD